MINLTPAGAARPADWDEEEDGEWEPPQVRNPACEAAGCGEWRRPKIRNPAYKGPWSPKMIPNPEYKGEWVQKTMPNPDYFVVSARYFACISRHILLCSEQPTLRTHHSACTCVCLCTTYS